VGYEFSGLGKPKNEHDIYSLGYASFVVPLVKGMQELNDSLKFNVQILKSENEKALQELNARNEEQQKTIMDLQTELKNLKITVDDLTKQINGGTKNSK